MKQLETEILSFKETDEAIAWYLDHPPKDSEKQESARKAARRIVAQVRQDPVAAEYMEAITGAGTDTFRHTEPWHAVGEQRVVAGLLAREALTMLASGNEAQFPAFYGTSVASVMLRSVPFFWLISTEDEADETPVPQHVISRAALPHASMFWSSEVARHKDGLSSNWTLLTHTDLGINVVIDIVRGNRLSFARLSIPYGSCFPDDFQDKEHRGVAAILARCAFINSPYIEEQRHKLPRALRRRARVHGVDSAKTEDVRIHVVVLRSAPSTVRETTPAGAGGRHHRWWVRGHIRAQWYSSQQAHKLIWIAPHLKGPEDKPLLKKVYSVSR